MKKNSIYILILITGLSMIACNREEKNLFGQSAEERLQAISKEVKTILTSSENGWEMIYFPNKERAGYSFLMKFYKDETVTIAAKNDVSCASHLYKTETSMWDIDFTQADVLTFNTYNNLFHAFSNPMSDGLGYEGDYEFVIMSYNENQLKLKGKKSDTYIYLHRLDKTVQWEDYFQHIDDYNWVTMCGNSKEEYLYQGGDSVFDFTYNTGRFYYKDSSVHYLGTITTPTGIHFYQSTPNNLGTEAIDFVVNEDSSRLVCVQNNAICIVPKYIGINYFTNKVASNRCRWTLTKALTDAETMGAVDKVNNTALTKGATINRYAFTEVVMRGDTVQALLVDYSVEGKLMQGYLELQRDIDVANNTITYSYLKASESIKPLLNRIGLNESLGAKKLTSIFCDTYTIQSCISNMNQTQLLMVSSSTPGKVLHVTADSAL